MSHTSGPWEIHWCWDVAGYPCFYIHGLAGDQKRDENVMAANARLIAAAPEMLGACKSALDALEDMHPLTAEVVRAAIAKAEGKP